MAPLPWSTALDLDTDGDRVRAVSIDLERIFATTRVTSTHCGPPRFEVIGQPAPAAEDLRPRIARYGAIAAAGALGLALGVVLRVGVAPPEGAWAADRAIAAQVVVLPSAAAGLRPRL